MVDQHRYDSSILEPSKIRSYARKVAAELTSSRSFTVTHQCSQTVLEDRGWFRADVRRTVAVGPSTEGWVVAIEREEGARDDHSWESGRIYFLRTDGELMSGEYFSTMSRNQDHADPLAGIYSYPLSRVDDSQLSWLDRPAAAQHYRKVKSKLSSDRQEMRAKYFLKVHAKGVGMSMALKRLRESR